MQKVIETNLSMKQGCDIVDHQSRVVEVETWDTYLDEIKNGECVRRKAYVGHMHGVTIPKNCKVLDFVSDDLHASCTVVLRDGMVTKKLMYRIME